MKKLALLALSALSLTACAETAEQHAANMERIQHERYLSRSDLNYYFNSPEKKKQFNKSINYEYRCPRIENVTEEDKCWKEMVAYQQSSKFGPDNWHPPTVEHSLESEESVRANDIINRIDNLGIGY